MIRIHKEGRFILPIFFLVLIFLNWVIYLLLPYQVVTWGAALVALIFFGFIINFFRNPKRSSSEQNVILAPADGKVVVIEETEEPEYFKDKRLQISIFMSPLDVHVNRSPIEGSVAYAKYHPGKYLVAWHPKSSTENERNTVVIKNEQISVLIRQIAGAVARRICFYRKENEQLKAGAEIGFIRFGSRVDLFLPVGTKVEIKLEQQLVGGETVVARY